MPEDALTGTRRTATDYLARPSPARIYDYLLGGDNNFEIDRHAAEELRATVPDISQVAWENRWFLLRVVRYLAAEAGIRQFLDIGAGLPSFGSVHETAGAVDGDVRVVYVDNDPLVMAQSREFLPDDRTTTVITADMREPDTILGHPDTRRLIDFSQPVGLLCVSVIHFVGDDSDPEGLMRTYRDAMPVGSLLALSHGASNKSPVEQLANTAAAYRNSTVQTTLRPAERIRGFFGGWDLVEPGLVPAHSWRSQPDHNARTGWLLAGLAHKT